MTELSREAGWAFLQRMSDKPKEAWYRPICIALSWCNTVQLDIVTKHREAGTGLTE